MVQCLCKAHFKMVQCVSIYLIYICHCSSLTKHWLTVAAPLFTICAVQLGSSLSVLWMCQEYHMLSKYRNSGEERFLWYPSGWFSVCMGDCKCSMTLIYYHLQCLSQFKNTKMAKIIFVATSKLLCYLRISLHHHYYFYFYYYYYSCIYTNLWLYGVFFFMSLPVQLFSFNY